MTAKTQSRVNTTFQDIAETMPDDLLAPIDRLARGATELETYGALSERQSSWLRDGVVYMPKLLPDELIDHYKAVWQQHNYVGRKEPRHGGWPMDTPYLHIHQLRDLALYAPLMDIMKELIGEEMGLHLNLTGWVSTERDWHQDSYLNGEHVGSYYAAVWMALDDISPASGPFQYVPGSHRWDVIRQKKLFKFLTHEQQRDPAWPALTQDWVAGLCQGEIDRQHAEIVTYTPKRGDVLIWHSQLVHRGSRAIVPASPRKALISHYSALSVRKDMPRRAQHDNGKYFFVFDHPLK